MRPIPTRPSASSPCSGPTTTAPRSTSRPRFAWVAGCSHIAVFIAGATTSGPRWASAVSVRRSSARPCARRARVLAVSGATTSSVCLLEVRVRIGRRLLPRERPERLGGDEPLGAARHDRGHVVPRPHELAHELAGLVGRDAARHAEENPRHGDSVPELIFDPHPWQRVGLRPRQRAPSGVCPAAGGDQAA